jgi:uncharacterized protein YxeA
MNKKIKIIIISIVALILIATAVGFSYNLKSQVNLEGYVIDEHCFSMKDPSTETVKCLKMEKCEASGYGIAVNQQDGKYKFYKFDANGHKLTKEIINKTDKTEKLTIVVKGKLEGETLKISKIQEKK